jgi:hypothetical protein
METKTFSVYSESELIVLIRKSVREEVRSILLELEPPHNNVTPNLIKIGEVAELFHVTKATIHSYKKKHLLPFKKIGRSLFFNKNEVLLAIREFNIKNNQK